MRMKLNSLVIFPFFFREKRNEQYSLLRNSQPTASIQIECTVNLYEDVKKTASGQIVTPILSFCKFRSFYDVCIATAKQTLQERQKKHVFFPYKSSSFYKIPIHKIDASSCSSFYLFIQF